MEGRESFRENRGSNGASAASNQPWQTVQKAANTLVAGDAVYIRAGTYPEQVVPQNSGSAGNYITFAAYPGETVTIDGSGIALPNDLVGLFHITGKEYIRVSGLRVIDAGPNNDNAGIMVLDSSNIIVENNSTYNTNSSGIGVWVSDNVTVDGDIQDNNGFAIGSEQGGLLENVWVYNNIAYNNRYVGLTIHNFFPSVCICRSYFEVTEHKCGAA